MKTETKESLKHCEEQIKAAKNYLLGGGKDTNKVIALLENALIFLTFSEIFQEGIEDKKQK